MSNLGLNVNMAGSGYSSGFTKHSHSQSATPGPTDLPIPSADSRQLSRRNTASGTPPRFNRLNSSASVGGRVGGLSSIQDERNKASRDRKTEQRAKDDLSFYDSSSGEDGACHSEDDLKDRRRTQSMLPSARPPFQNDQSRSASRSHSQPSDDTSDDELDEERELSLPDGMKAFEVSAKDNQGVHDMFSFLIQGIIERRHVIEHERKLRERDSVMLTNSDAPSWSKVAEDGEREAMKNSGRFLRGWGSCCT